MRLLPSPSTSAKLFATGLTVGPVVDSLHNQCLLQYDILPISLPWPEALAASQPYEYFFCSSWTVPPLLGVAYVVLGGILPRLFQIGIDTIGSGDRNDKATNEKPSSSAHELRTRAVVAVLTTAMIIKLSEFLETHQYALDGLPIHVPHSEANLLVMFAAALSQWALLDGTLAALLAASITSVGGPLSELPFVANGFWTYLPQAGDYLPLAHVSSQPQLVASVLSWLLGDDFRDLALSSITGPCYFAVTMDAIALGRWFDSTSDEDI
jgi:hypothetical protein